MPPLARRTFLRRYGGHGYRTVFADFVPMLEARGVSAAQIETMLLDNPSRMLTLAGSKPS